MGSEATEYYLNAAPASRGALESQITDLFTQVRKQLETAQAWIMSERIYCSCILIPLVRNIRKRAFEGWEEGIDPVYLEIPDSGGEAFAGIQVHAVGAAGRPIVLKCGSTGCCARLLRGKKRSWLSVSGLTGSDGHSSSTETFSIFEKAESILKWAGGSFRDVARTWFWLSNIHDSYGGFNRVRNEFFKRRGLMGSADARTHLPASTGIGIHAAGSRASALDLIAVLGDENSIRFSEAGGDLNSPASHGMAFSRAAVARMPGGSTVFISGTAAIDAGSRTEQREQIYTTITQVRETLRELGCGDDQVLSATVYCATPEIEQEFDENWGDLSWPRVLVPAQICRPDLSFEIEVTASPAA